MENHTPRYLAAQIIARWLSASDFPNRLLNTVRKDRAFVTETVQGVVRWKRLLEWVLKQIAERMPPPSLEAFLLTGLYQILMMEETADYAAVNETVSAAKKRFSAKQADFVNAVLRRAVREREEILAEINKQPAGIKYSHPDLLLNRWLKIYGAKETLRLCEWNNTRPNIIIRVNTLKPADRIRAFVSQLEQKGILSAKCRNNYFPLPHGLRIEDLPGYADGMFLVMDPFAANAIELLNPQPEEKILDACAAPGGKTFLIAEKMRFSGKLHAFDASEDRLRIMKTNFQRLQISKFVEVSKQNIFEIPNDKSAQDSAMPSFIQRETCPKTVCHSRLDRESRSRKDLEMDSRRSLPRTFPPRTDPPVAELRGGNDRHNTGSFRKEMYDRILADVPCSNTGVIRRKPDIRWRFSLKGLSLLVRTQRKMLDRLAPLLKTGGTLVYSTCSLEPEENQMLVKAWLKANPSFYLVTEKKYFPPVTGTDGGYAAAIVKN